MPRTYAKIPHILKTWGVYQWKSYLIGSKKLDSVRRYADVQVARKRALMERGKIESKVIPMRGER